MESFSATPMRRSAKPRRMAPPSDVRRPPSKAAVIFLRETAGNENGRIVLSVMASVAAPDAPEGLGVSNPILRHVSELRHARQPLLTTPMNKTG